MRDLVTSTRTIVVPIVNPDGFNASREAGELYGNGGGTRTDLDGDGEIDDAEFIAAASTHPNEYRRKNCRFADDGPRRATAPRSRDQGVVGRRRRPEPQLRRVLGRPRARATTSATQDYRGPGPFSEPESQNIRELISAARSRR